MISTEQSGRPPRPPDSSRGRPSYSILDGLDTTPLGVAVFDRELRFVHVNAALANANRMTVEAHLGRTMAELFPGLEGPIATIEARLRAVLETGAPAVFSIVRSGPAEAHREWMASVFAVRGAGGEVDAACGIFADVTAEREGAVALARAREAAEGTSRRLACLLEVTAALSAAAEPASVAEVVVERARDLVGASAAIVRLAHGDGLELLAASAELRHAVSRRLPLEADRPCTAVARVRQPLWLGDPRAIRARFPALVPWGDALATLPLALPGHVLGTLTLVFDASQPFDLEARALLLSLAEYCAQALDRAFGRAAEAAAREDAQRLAGRLARLQEITAALSAARTPEEIARTITDRAHAVVGAAVSVAYALEAGGDHLRLLGTRGADPAIAARFERIPVTAPLPACRAAATGERIWLEARDAIHAQFPALAGLPDAARREAVVALPLTSGAAVVGALGFTFDAPRHFDDAERSFFLSIAEQCGVALDRARLLEDERRAREEADRARTLLDGVLENAPIGLAFFDREYRYQRINPTLAAMNGVPAAAHLGRTPREVLPADPSQDRLEAAWRGVVETGEPLVDLEIGAEVSGAGGPRRWVSSWYPVRAEGETVGVGAVVREVTRERQAEEFQRHVIGVVGHDLRNPLSAIVNAAAVLLRSDPDARQVRALDRIARSAARIGEIVGALLDYANVRGGRGVPLRRRPCDLSDVAKAVVEECHLAHPGREIRCAGEGDCSGAWDPDRMAQVLTNLVSNAVHHASPGTAIEVRWHGSVREVVVEVENAGPPIPPEVAPRLFEPFRQGEGGARAGLGLGLFIARAIVDAHHGAIEVRSAAGRTVFAVRLPHR